MPVDTCVFVSIGIGLWELFRGILIADAILELFWNDLETIANKHE